jgi:hypothetical protein
MAFRSILFDRPELGTEIDARAEPACFADLDQIVTSMTAGRDEYHLQPFFYAPLDACSCPPSRSERTSAPGSSPTSGGRRMRA